MLKKASVILLVLGAIALSAWHFTEYALRWDSDFIADDMVSHWDKRMAAVRADIPSDVKIIGYVGDWDILPAGEFIYAGEETEFVLTQYALAPVIVQRGDNYEYMILNLSPKAYETWLQRQPQNVNITDYGLKIYLAARP